MTFVPDTLAGRTIAILLIGLGVFHAIGLWLYNTGFHAEIGYSNERQLAERLVSVKRVIRERPPAEREAMAHSVSGPTIEVHWSLETPIAATPSSDPAALTLRAHLAELAPEIAASGLRVAVSHQRGSLTKRHSIWVAVQLDDDSWINFSVADPDGPTAAWYGTLLFTTAVALGVLIISIILVRGANAPLRVVTEAARRLGHDPAAEPPIPVHGPREAREAAMAFNDMRARITRLMESRVQTLAAVSHDLKSPLTRLRLRTELLGDDQTREIIAADVAEMETMIDTVLAFLRGEAETEPSRALDIASLCATICNDFADQGHDVVLARTAPVVLPARRVMLKRAIGNLIANGVKYGHRVRVTIERRDSQVAVVVDDDGPGIPAEHMGDVFEPFWRMSGTRGRDGVGLGLTVARMAARAHGGDVMLSNRAGGGLRAELLLSLPEKG
ncbi:ATP-binding protein [Reyranella sp. CPCC 100927]|uniref:ATP-binding protein n=1 Tax=Reyranella sp. CPCC 100927 TaxID=2599616 RepID=UPI0011B5E153|nr:ATP-binding protein [Reyranella sp. CPCC 100927]TWT11637.1 HAMP domain-containing protein [Reyranella sp. CPCC 100927]